MKQRTYLYAIMAIFAGLSLSFQTHNELCEGFLPENDLKIPIAIQMLQGGGLSEGQFNSVLDRLQSIYGPIISAQGGSFDISRQWSNNTVNASAQRFGSTYRINMYGGLARHPEMNADGFALVACHEVGHHLGGAPKTGGWFNNWASNEGQSDYFAGLQCLRRMWPAEENSKFVEQNDIDPFLLQTCHEAWREVDEINLCTRIGSAGMVVTSLFRALREEEGRPQFNTPDPSRVSRTDHSHPGTQCRLDTYFQGGLCTKRFDEGLSDTDVRQGTCVESQGFQIGIRPRCWYGESY